MFLAFVLATFYRANWKLSSFPFFNSDISAAPKANSTIMTKVEMTKDIPLLMLFFCHLDRANSIKTALQGLCPFLLNCD